MAQQLQQLIAKLDGTKRTLLMSKLSAVSSKRATPLVLAWVASTLQEETLAMIQKDRLAVFYSDLVMAARMAKDAMGRGGDNRAASEEHDLVLRMLRSRSLSWIIMLSMPRLEELIEALSGSNPKLDLAFRVLDLSNPGSRGDGPSSSNLASGTIDNNNNVRHGVALALGALSSDSVALLMDAMEHEKGKQVPLDLLASVSAKYASSPSTVPERIAAAVVGLALERFVGVALGLYLQPDVQMTTRLLRVSPFDVVSQQQGRTNPLSVITPDLLKAVVKQLMEASDKPASDLGIAKLLEDAAEAAAAPSKHQGKWGSPKLALALQSSAKADASGPASKLLACLSAWRRSAMLMGVPCVAATATAGELASLTAPDRAMLRAMAEGMDATGRAMESLVLPGPAAQGNPVDLDTVRRAMAQVDDNRRHHVMGAITSFLRLQHCIPRNSQHEMQILSCYFPVVNHDVCPA